MKLLYFTLSCLLIFTNSALALPAFPGAMGMGADTVGGRGGTVYIVDTLSDNPAAGVTLREAVEASGPRTIIFAVSGRIDLQKRLTITNPYLTIAGQTSPGGIVITGEKIRIFRTHDIVIRHLRIKPGYSNEGDDDADMDGLQIWGDASHYNSTDTQYHSYNIVIDHCSISDTMDEIMDTAYTVYDITLSNNLFYGAWRNPPNVNGKEAEGNHNRGPLLWGKYNAVTPTLSFHGNAILSLESRFPEVSFNHFVDIQNNVSYDGAGSRVTTLYGNGSSYDMKANFINNFDLEGPHSNTGRSSLRVCSMKDNSIYYKANYPCNISGGDVNWCVGDDCDSNGTTVLASANLQSSTIFPTVGVSKKAIPVLTSPLVTKADALVVVQAAGATKPFQDSDDFAIKQHFIKETDGVVYGARNFTTDLPSYSTTNDNPKDTDSDGMPDSWETANNLPTTTANNNGHNLDSNYTDIEVYINSLANQETIIIVPPSVHAPITN